MEMEYRPFLGFVAAYGLLEFRVYGVGFLCVSGPLGGMQLRHR